jgi:hypothetical protein
MLSPAACTEYTPAERAEGLHNNSLKFAYESKSERGWNNSTNGKGGVSKSIDDPSVKVVATGTV